MGQATNLHHQTMSTKNRTTIGLTYTREKGKIDITCWQNKGHQRTYDEGTAIGQFMWGSPQTLDPLHRPSATLGHEISPDRVSPEPCICPLSRIRGTAPNRWPIYQVSWHFLRTTSVSSLCRVHNYIWPPLNTCGMPNLTPKCRSCLWVRCSHRQGSEMGLAFRIPGWALAWTKIPQDSPCLAYEIYEFIKQTLKKKWWI